MEPKCVVSNCADLSVGDEIDVWSDGRLVHGTVTDLLPHLGLFWIRETLLNERRVLDMAHVQVTRTDVSPRKSKPAAA